MVALSSTVQDAIERLAQECVLEFDQLWEGRSRRGEDYGSTNQFLQATKIYHTQVEIALRAEVLRHSVPTFRRWNARAPHGIAKLPTEVLQIVLENVWSTTGSTDILVQLLWLRAVSHKWRQVVDGTSSLWTRIVSVHHPEFISMALQKSTNRSLDLNLSGRYGQDDQHLAFVQQALPHYARWSSIRDDYVSTERTTLYDTLPPLSLISLELHAGYSWRRSRVPFLGRAPLEKLENLWLYDFSSLEWRDSRTGNIRSLRICGFEEVDLTLILGIALENPHLQTLLLENVQNFTLSTPLTPDKPHTAIKNLKTFRFSYLDRVTPRGANFAYQFLNHIQLPVYEEFCSCLPFVPGVTNSFQEFKAIFPDPVRFLQPSLLRTSASSPEWDFLSLELSRDSVSIYIESTNEDETSPNPYRITLKGAPELTRPWARALVQGAPEVAFSIAFMVTADAPETDWFHDFADCENVTQLSVYAHWYIHKSDYQRAAGMLLQLLYEPLALGPPSVPVPYPGLTRIDFDTEMYDMLEIQSPAILRMVKGRLSAMKKRGITPLPTEVTVEWDGNWKTFVWPDVAEIGEMEWIDSISMEPPSNTNIMRGQ